VPAEQHVTAVAAGGEVEQAEIEVLEHDAELLEPLDAGDRRVRQAAESDCAALRSLAA
jgi:hypothetical protein